MSTRSNVGIQNTDGSVTFIYVHFDGYPSGVGATLHAHYDEAKARALVALGDCSTVNRLVEPPSETGHSYGRPAEGVTVAYMRDRGEKDCDARTAPERGAMRQQEYAYLFVPGEGWLFSNCHKRTEQWVPLADALAKDPA